MSTENVSAVPLTPWLLSQPLEQYLNGVSSTCINTSDCASASPSSSVASTGRVVKRTYKCQRCANHGQSANRRGHKEMCPYRTCECRCCGTIDKRRSCNKRLQALTAATALSIADRQTGSRKPKCDKCAHHGVIVELKNHKRMCPWNNCECAVCSTVEEKRKIMSEQIMIRREQSKYKEPTTEPDSTTSTDCNSAAHLQPAMLNALTEYLKLQQVAALAAARTPIIVVNNGTGQINTLVDQQTGCPIGCVQHQPCIMRWLSSGYALNSLNNNNNNNLQLNYMQNVMMMNDSH